MNALWRTVAIVPLCVVCGCGKTPVEHHEPTLSDRLETVESHLESLNPKDRESFRQLEQELDQALSKIELKLDPDSRTTRRSGRTFRAALPEHARRSLACLAVRQVFWPASSPPGSTVSKQQCQTERSTCRRATIQLCNGCMCKAILPWKLTTLKCVSTSNRDQLSWFYQATNRYDGNWHRLRIHTSRPLCCSL